MCVCIYIYMHMCTCVYVYEVCVCVLNLVGICAFQISQFCSVAESTCGLLCLTEQVCLYLSRGGATNKVLNRGFSSIRLALLIDSMSDSLEQRLPLTVPSRTHVLAWPLSIRSLSYSLSSLSWINKLSFWATTSHNYIQYCTIGHSSCHRRPGICWRNHRERTCIGITWGIDTPNYLEKLLSTVLISSQLSKYP